MLKQGHITLNPAFKLFITMLRDAIKKMIASIDVTEFRKSDDEIEDVVLATFGGNRRRPKEKKTTTEKILVIRFNAGINTVHMLLFLSLFIASKSQSASRGYLPLSSISQWPPFHFICFTVCG